MEKDENFELFYDVLDKTILILYEIRHDNFFDLLINTGKNILACDVLDHDADNKLKARLMRWYKKLEGVDFISEEIRKAFNMMVLRGFKEQNMKLGDVTPDTIGIFVAYLISKLKPNSKKLKILDPVVGAGNFLYTVSNHLDKELNLYGIDNIREVLELATIQGDLLNYPIEMYNQDTLTHPFTNMDIVIADLPDYYSEAYDNRYFPYLCILEHLNSLNADGYMITIVPNDFFSKDTDNFFKDNLKDTGSVIAVLELPSDMFVANPKSIVMFSKTKLESKKCLVTKLPSFKNIADVSNTLTDIELWFENSLEIKGDKE